MTTLRLVGGLVVADLVSLIAEVLADTDPEWVGEGVCETATWARRAAGVLVDRLNLRALPMSPELPSKGSATPGDLVARAAACLSAGDALGAQTAALVAIAAALVERTGELS